MGKICLWGIFHILSYNVNNLRKLCVSVWLIHERNNFVDRIFKTASASKHRSNSVGKVAEDKTVADDTVFAVGLKQNPVSKDIYWQCLSSKL